jgi:RNA polymerase sigma-70 factor (ECF subfamily)
VFLLRDVIDYDYAEIARIVGKSEVNTRQMLRRARQHIAERRPRFEASPQKHEQIAEQFREVSATGDPQRLLTLLSEDVVLWSDGGGKARAALKPIKGATNVVRFIIGALRKFVPAARVIETAEINGQPGIISYFGRRPQSAVILDTVNGRIQTIFIVTNPEKLQSLPDLSTADTPT